MNLFNEWLVTDTTSVWFLYNMYPLVHPQLSWTLERFVTLNTSIWSLFRMYAYMTLQRFLVMECLITHIKHKYVPFTTYSFLSFNILLMPELVITHTRWTWMIHITYKLTFIWSMLEKVKREQNIRLNFEWVTNSNLKIKQFTDITFKHFRWSFYRHLSFHEFCPTNIP